MADLIAIGYPDQATADAAAEEARRLAADLIIQPDAIAVIVRDEEGGYHVHTNHHLVGGGATWGMFWGLLFGLLFFIPLFGMAIGAAAGALGGALTDVGIDDEFIAEVRRQVTPGTSALFLMTSDAVEDRVVEELGFTRGHATLIHANLSPEQEAKLREAFEQEPATT